MQGAQKASAGQQALGKSAVQGARSSPAAEAWLGGVATRGAGTAAAAPTAQRARDGGPPPRSLLDQVEGGYEVVATRPDGTTDTYRGRDITAFVEHRDDFHSHEVRTPDGARSYLRDRWGFVQVGTDPQIEKQRKAVRLGRVAVHNSERRMVDPERSREDR